MDVNRDGTYSCIRCKSKFETKSELINHNICIHNSKKHYKACNKCDYKTTNRRSLDSHQTTHRVVRSYKCSVCGLNYKTSNYLNSHMRLHRGEKEFECEICGLKFAFKGNCKAHMKIHSKQKPYKCPTCDSSFALNRILKAHITRMHRNKNLS